MIPNKNYIWAHLGDLDEDYDYVGSKDRQDPFLKGSICQTEFFILKKFSTSEYCPFIIRKNISHISRYENYVKDCEQEIEDILE